MRSRGRSGLECGEALVLRVALGLSNTILALVAQFVHVDAAAALAGDLFPRTQGLFGSLAPNPAKGLDREHAHGTPTNVSDREGAYDQGTSSESDCVVLALLEQ